MPVLKISEFVEVFISITNIQHIRTPTLYNAHTFYPPCCLHSLDQLESSNDSWNYQQQVELSLAPDVDREKNKKMAPPEHFMQSTVQLSTQLYAISRTVN